MMQLEEIPVIGSLLAAGADDRVFDLLLLLGPLSILAITILGRTLLSVVIAAIYIGGFFGYVVYKGLR